MGNAIEIKNVSKAFENQQILENVSMKIEHGQCCLLLGKNGSGKTTLLRCLFDLLQPDSGEVTISELKYSSEAIQIKELIGIVSEDNPLIPEFRAYTYLELVGLLHKIPSGLLKIRIDTVFDYFFENKADISKQIMNLSTGMMKKLSLCAAILHKPKILILDEPFSGLDIYSLNIFTLFLKSYLAEGNTILFTSHSFDNLNDIITHIAVLDNKKIVFHDTIDVFTDFGEKQIDKSLLNILHDKNRFSHSKLELL
jgi:ABC-type multidrug transport system ATPase subunit